MKENILDVLKIKVSPDNCKNMGEIREGIDIIDEQIVDLIALRSKFVREAAKYKKDENAVKDKERVKKVLESKRKLAVERGVSPELIVNIYSTMIDHFVNEELKKWKEG